MRVVPRRPVLLWITADISSSVWSEPFIRAATLPSRARRTACSAASRGVVAGRRDLEGRGVHARRFGGAGDGVARADQQRSRDAFGAHSRRRAQRGRVARVDDAERRPRRVVLAARPGNERGQPRVRLAQT